MLIVGDCSHSAKLRFWYVKDYLEINSMPIDIRRQNFSVKQFLFLDLILTCLEFIYRLLAEMVDWTDDDSL